MNRNFPDFIEAYLKYTEHHEATRKLHKWTAVSIVAAAMERRVWLPRGYYTLFPNLYIFIIGKSGLIKKSTSTAIGVDLLRELPDFKIMSERLTAGSLIEQLWTNGKVFNYGGEECKQSAVYCYASELAVFVTEVFGTITELLTTFYDCQPQDWRKPWVYNNKKEGSKRIFGPCMNILGASTKEWLRRTISTDEMMGGFTSRVIFVVENNPPDRLVAWPDPPDHVAQMRPKLIQDLTAIYSLVGIMQPTPEAKKRFSQWYDFHMRTQVPKVQDPRFAGYMGRKGDLLLKLAMIKSASRGATLSFGVEELIWAGEMLEEVEQTMMEAFDSRPVDPLEVLATRIYQYVESVKVVSEKDIRQAFATDVPSISGKDFIGEALDLLCSNGTLRPMPGEIGGSTLFSPGLDAGL